MKSELYYERIISVAVLRKVGRLQVDQAGKGGRDVNWLEPR